MDFGGSRAGSDGDWPEGPVPSGMASQHVSRLDWILLSGTVSRWTIASVVVAKTLEGAGNVKVNQHTDSGNDATASLHGDHPRPTVYHAVDGAIVGHNRGRFNNRPLYGNNQNDVILGGDRPVIRFGRKPMMFGAMMVGVIRGNHSVWCHEAADITVAYRAGHLQWTVRDAALPGLNIMLDVVPTVAETGMAVRVQVEGAHPSDQLVWAFGGSQRGVDPNADFDAVVHEEAITSLGFPFKSCLGNVVGPSGKCFFVEPAPVDSEQGGVPQYRALGRCSQDSQALIGDARQGTSPVTVLGSVPSDSPLLYGSFPLSDAPVFWEIHGGVRDEQPELTHEPAEAFTRGLTRARELAERVTVLTPEPRLDALASASVAAIDGLWYPPFFVHSAMLWNMPFAGWRVMYGATMYGWHERVRAACRPYCVSQVVESDKVKAQPDPNCLGSIQGSDSRFYGKGRVTLNAGMYDMQSQLFDQLIREWYWTADPELEAMLRPALDLHLEWLQECFDPDGDGAYESYINAWPTDSVWYNGGGSAEATSYAYNGHRAALAMARRAGDQSAMTRHQAALERIHSGLFEQLWVKEEGHSGKCREQGGHRRLHEDAWLYGVFLPIDAGLLSEEQAASSLYYSEWAFQNDRKPYGGRMVWNSNWVPGIWSVRYDWPGDNYHLALAYFQAGQGDEGWDVFSGTFLGSAYETMGLGNLGHKVGGGDFGDCSNMFARTLVEGLFGYRPDYPAGFVTLAPTFPSTWDQASIHVPDVSLTYQRTGKTIALAVTLARPAAMKIVVPIRAGAVTSVQADGAPCPYEVVPGFGCSQVVIKLSERAGANIGLIVDEPIAQGLAIHSNGILGNEVEYDVGDYPITAFSDPQGMLMEARLEEGRLKGRLAGRVGHHQVMVTVQVGALTQWRLVRVRIDDPAAVAQAAAAALVEVPVGVEWKCVSLDAVMNADVRRIFQQQYLSPRPETVSVRLGTDGWSPWPVRFWNLKPPTLELDHVPVLLDQGCLRTPEGACFKWSDAALNIAFASQWDNYPTCVQVPVDLRGDAVWLLVCGSTNPMQCQIANAVIRFRYDDGVVDLLELVPPRNFWALAPMEISGSASGQLGRADYDHPIDAFCVPRPYPSAVWLGQNCRAMVYGRRLRNGHILKEVTLEVLSQEVVIGLMGVSVMNPC